MLRQAIEDIAWVILSLLMILIHGLIRSASMVGLSTNARTNLTN